MLFRSEGRWTGILATFQVDPVLLKGKHRPCLLCGGRDRARWDKNKELYYCNQCGSKNPIDLILELTGMDFRDLADQIRPNREKYKVTTQTTNEQAEQRIKAIWKGLKPLVGTLGEVYIKSRGIEVLPERDCYFHPGIDYYEDGEVKGTYPAIVSRFTDVDGIISTCHVIYLNESGDKLEVDHPKKILPVIRPLSGCTIKLFESATHIAIAEGIETALAVYQLEGYPTWVAGSAGNMEKIELPPEVKAVTIYVDEDENFAGAKSAYILANRLSIKGLRVRMCRLSNQTKNYEVGIKFDFLNYLNS